MKSIIKPFEIPRAAAPWVGVDILEKGKTAGVKPAATTKASKQLACRQCVNTACK